uniref:Uncharacterized protein n=1 Tax=Eutreptiella gymnastica TaxID=73025 RepID=A0A7S4CAJ7_9EUGL
MSTVVAVKQRLKQTHNHAATDISWTLCPPHLASPQRTSHHRTKTHGVPPSLDHSAPDLITTQRTPPQSRQRLHPRHFPTPRLRRYRNVTL